MCKLIINGGKRLCGEVLIQGSKNAVLPILAAALLTEGTCVIHNCPNITDVHAALEILEALGAVTDFTDGTVTVTAKNICSDRIPRCLMEKMRSSVMFLGAILARCGTAVVCSPGGCKLGERPIDIHLRAMGSLGVKICEDGECICCDMQRPHSEDITLIYPSVGATENIMLMCASLNNKVKIYNAAKEPEIVDLQNFINMMGADVRGAGTDVITIYPSGRLSGCEYTVMPDRIVAATYACAAAACGGEVKLDNAEAGHMRIVLAALAAAGCEVSADEFGIRVSAAGRPRAIEMIKTLPYPGFPTDAQPLFGTVLSLADGVSEISEAIFKNRFSYATELAKLGADLRIDGSTLNITGVGGLVGAEVSAADLRGGAALVIGGVAADGITSVSGVEFIDRGYENIERDLTMLGADIVRVRDA